MYEEMVLNIYDAVCNSDSTPNIEAKIEESWAIYEKEPTEDNALAFGSMYELRGFFLGFEAAKKLLLQGSDLQINCTN